MQPVSKWLLQNRGCLRQTLACCAVSILTFIFGMLQTWPSLALGRIQNGAAGFLLTSEDTSTIVSMSPLGMLFMMVMSRFIPVKIGRKTSLLFGAVTYMVAWALILLASSPVWLIAAFFITGFGNGTVLIMGPIYIAEIADKRIRGALISFYITVIAIGQIFMTSVAIFIPYFALNVVGLSLTIFALLCITFFAVESPSWYLIENDSEKAKNSFRYYWSSNMGANDLQVSAALAVLKETVEAEMNAECSYRELFRSPSNTRASIIVIALSLVQGAGGIVAILTYGSSTLPQYDGFWEPNFTMALVVILNFVFNLVSTLLVDNLGRKPLSIVSNAGCALGTGMVAVYFFVERYTSLDNVNIKWLPAVGMLVFISFYGGAMASIPHILVAELFPVNVRYHASIVMMCCATASVAFFNYIYLGVSHYAGVWVLYLIFTLFSVAAAVFSCFYLIETKNLTLTEIQLKVMGKYLNT